MPLALLLKLSYNSPGCRIDVDHMIGRVIVSQQVSRSVLGVCVCNLGVMLFASELSSFIQQLEIHHVVCDDDEVMAPLDILAVLVGAQAKLMSREHATSATYV